MSDNGFHVVLFTDDSNLSALVERHRPSGAVLHRLPAADATIGEAPPADQYWIDLDAGCVPDLPDCHRRAYFFSKFTDELRKLPPGLFMRKPCTPAVIAVLWADVAVEDSAPRQGSGNENEDWLPGWVLDLHELDMRELCDRCVDTLSSRLGYSEVALYLNDPEQKVLTLAKTNAKRNADLSVPLVETNKHVLASAARSMSTLITDDVVRTCAARELQLPSAVPHDASLCGVFAPLRAHDALQGVLQMTHDLCDAAAMPKPPPERLYSFLARSLLHARLHKQARTEARVDRLTSLYNYRWMIESLAREIRRSQRYGAPLSLIMIDLDELKTVNDRFGHLAGDALLRHAAGKIGSALRQIDSAARIGGDEFVALLPSTDLAGAGQVARRILTALSSDAPVINERPLPVALSVGVAQWEPGWDESRLIEAADQAMYVAKRQGHNRMVCRPYSPTAANADQPSELENAASA